MAQEHDDRPDSAVVLAALGDAVRPVIRLYAQGYSVREIAARLGREQETVKRTLSRARRALRTRYDKDEEEPV